MIRRNLTRLPMTLHPKWGGEHPMILVPHCDHSGDIDFGKLFRVGQFCGGFSGVRPDGRKIIVNSFNSSNSFFDKSNGSY